MIISFLLVSTQKIPPLKLTILFYLVQNFIFIFHHIFIFLLYIRIHRVISVQLNCIFLEDDVLLLHLLSFQSVVLCIYQMINI